MNSSNMLNAFMNRLVFIANYLVNSSDNLSSLLNRHVGKILEINFNNFLLRLIIKKNGIFEVIDYSHNNSDIVVTFNESIFEVFKSVNYYGISSLSKFMYVSGDLYFMNDMSILLQGIEMASKDKFHKAIESFMSNISWINNNICCFGFRLLKSLNGSFYNEIDFLASRTLYQDFEDNMQSLYMDIKKAHIRVNNLLNNINNLIDFDL
ncbi:hypothetical protein BCUE_0283 [Candidatus Kinetoplastibacterium blastocrithidii TCC012E]|uniref:Uncharacterized protein n=1 Tax=Candidatus Kinetoplastidibacterium blastocrithidiae TCC012E TaxID=1208922 RepID=M1M2U1_9PROT|nr:hypothetical protein [Candidatus Kinetoplastibacterium blastocrithidii]AFZ83418.1 hypothetical protein CKBE_00229 [Candidatus Kinetoplastibacterium blastocrithidii (ex Strigomonas culicis)]AGF49514.1 hypothetical protein BCUE_0283 [Candidatus Kinetoplastibacterium blastocrithidii TCC012E]